MAGARFGRTRTVSLRTGARSVGTKADTNAMIDREANSMSDVLQDRAVGKPLIITSGCHRSGGGGQLFVLFSGWAVVWQHGAASWLHCGLSGDRRQYDRAGVATFSRRNPSRGINVLGGHVGANCVAQQSHSCFRTAGRRYAREGTPRLNSGANVHEFSKETACSAAF
jgi:hypothetical protein